MKIFRIANLIHILAIWTVLSQLFLLLIFTLFLGPNSRAVMLMATGLMVLWIMAGGTLMWMFREPIREWVLKAGLNWVVKFVLFCILLALFEEAIAVFMTNLAPLFGVPVGAAYITASTNYFDVVIFHSVMVFIPMFIVWAFLLSRWSFSHTSVFLLFGLTGFLSEAIFAGTFDLARAPFWIFIYGLMIWLPAYSLPVRKRAKPPRWWVYPLALFAPFFLAVPLAILVSSLHPVSIHFPPILPNS
ncbi:MAG: hypothetical protein QY332_04080 [Anaerolineales bacterium]|nr:MAG: hypothetical protein QY332_04080 [Anaerolineales bacterium]